MFKAIFLVDNALLPQKLIEDKAVQIFNAAPKVMLDTESGKAGASLVELTVSGAALEILKLASQDETFGIQSTENAVVEV